ncbi:hypothetical protein [Gordonia liuliyuniae]|uniref:Uncharacterized protein n=1 Tax=Gordonia liuliyuniae TaxID=2911517 RepID=A0ABS9IQI9_9ACTN|nr:hypothetical protein [Gordonia liuliyuniae]MCF8587816.1 hypothetical protein [Gordonia liuliyuniae]
MSTLALVLRELHRSEHRLALDLDGVSHRHQADHDICYIAGDLAEWSREHLRAISDAAPSVGIDLESSPRTTALASGVAEPVSELFGHRPGPALVLLLDLRRLHQQAAGVAVDWQLLAQGAHATRSAGLVELAARCRPQTSRQLDWTSAMLKVLSPQALSG